MQTTILTARDLTHVVEHTGLSRLMDMTIDGLTQAFNHFDGLASQTPARDGFEYSNPHTGLIEWMPAMQTGEAAVVKLVGYHPANPEVFALPTILSTALELDTRTGRLLTLLDSTFLTALRTGAASAVASRILASSDSRTLGLVGAGAQSITQVHALSRVFDLEQVILYDTDPATMASFAERINTIDHGNMRFRTDSLEQLCRHSDIICTTTSVENGGGPVFPDNGLKSWVHVNAVGSDFPGKTEIPLSLLERSLVCPDFTPQALREGECQQLQESALGPDLVRLVKNPEEYSAHSNGPTVFDSTGWALEDYVVVKMFLDLAENLGCGTQVELTSLSADPKSPYGFVDNQSEHLSRRAHAQSV